MTHILKELLTDDMKDVEEILRSTGFFYDFEIDIALWMAGETIAHGMEETGFHWMKVVEDGTMIAFANYGKDPMSVHSWDLNWIAVHQNSRNRKIGAELITAVEDDVRFTGGKILWAETSGRPLYAPTERFYIKNGYHLQATLKDFYGPGDPKQVYSKVLVPFI
jgi:GNAT superfamily N-acetyltransferase